MDGNGMTYAIAAIEALMGVVMALYWRVLEDMRKDIAEAANDSKEVLQKLERHVERDEEFHRQITSLYVPAEKLDKTFQRIFDRLDDIQKEFRAEFKERDKNRGRGE